MMQIPWIHQIRMCLAAYIILYFTSALAMAAQRHLLEAEAAELIGGASKTTDPVASEGYSVRLAKPGQGIEFSGLPAAATLAVRYASVETGTISIAVNDQPARKVNVHSSGSVSGSFLYAVMKVEISAGARLNISQAADDVAVNIDQLITGEGDL